VWGKGVFVRVAELRVIVVAAGLLLLLILNTACGGIPPIAPSAHNGTPTAQTISGPSTPPVSPTTPITVPAPQSVPVLPHQVTLGWIPSPSLIDGYIVYRSVQVGGPYSRITSAPVALTSFIDANVSGGQTYYYVVTAVASTVESVFSNETTATVPAP
jgi:hypothetical protein